VGRILGLVAVAVVALTGCSGDISETEPYQELQAERDQLADEFDAVEADFVALLAASIQVESGLSADESQCVGQAIVADAGARSAFPALVVGDESLDALEGAVAVAKAFESCGFDIDELEPPDASGGLVYGDDPELDALFDACDAGDGAACDELYWSSAANSEYETFGGTCGGRFPSLAESPESCDGEI
jgi:hypothetical protein